MSNWSGGDWINWSSSSAIYYPTTVTASGTNLLPFNGYIQPQPLPSVAESVAGPLSDRKWLDAQITEVCDLAEAA